MTLNYVDPWEGRSTQPISSAGTQPSQDKNKGFFGDLIDSIQQGAAQSFAGDAEAIGQVSGSDTFKSLGKSLAQLSNSQTQTMTDEAQQALSQHIFKDDANNMTGVAFDDGATNWRTWALQFGVLGGQVAGTMATGFGAGSVVKAGAKTAIKAFAKEAVTKEAQQLVAKNAVKEAIRNGALDDVRSALVAAPDKAAINSVLNAATYRLGGIANTATAGAMAAGMRAQQARDEYLGLDADTLNQNPEFQKEYWAIADLPENQGLDTATIHNAAKNQLAEKAATTAFFDKTALLSDLASGAYVPGVGGVLERGAATASKLGRFGIGLAEESATEAWQGGETQRAVNEAIKEWGNESRDPMAGVIQTRWEEGTLGGVFGGMAKVAEGQHQAPTKPIVTVENSPSTGNSNLDSALAQSNADEQSRYDTLTGHVDELSKPAYMRNGDISPALENAIAQFRLDAIQQQQAQQRKDGIMQPLDNKITGNPDEPAFLRSSAFNPTGRDIAGAPDVDPNTPIQQALARSQTSDNSVEAMLAETVAGGEQGKSLYETTLNDEGLVPEARRLPNNGTINLGGTPGDGINNNYIPPILSDRPDLATAPTADPVITERQQATIPAGGAREAGVMKPTNSPVTGDPDMPAYLRQANISDELRAAAQGDTTQTPGGNVQPQAEAGVLPPRNKVVTGNPDEPAYLRQLSTLRVTRRGKPFGSVKEAQLASRKNETPIELPTGGYGVVDKAELEQARANQAPTATITNDGAKSKNIPDSILSAFPDMPVSNEGYLGLNPFTLSEREALKNAGLVQEVKSADGSSYLAVDPEKLWDLRKTRSEELKNTKTEISQEERNRAIENRASSYDRLANEQDELGDLGDKELAAKYRAKAEEIRQRKSTSQPNADQAQANQAPTATVMNGGTKSDNVIDQVSLNERGDNRESPWLFADGKVISSNGDHISLSDEYGYSGYRDMSKGTGAIRSTFYKPRNSTDEQTPFVSLQLFDDQKLTPEQFKSVESFVKANDAKITLGVDRSGNNTDNVEKNEISLDELKGKYTADQAAGMQSPETVTAPVVAKESQPQQASNVEQISESYLKDVDLLKEHAGKWKYRYAVGANWQTANSKESAIEIAQEAHQKAIANGDPLPTKAERYATSEAEQAAQIEQRYGKMSIPELENEHARLGGVVSDLQQTGKNEFNGNGGRRTGAATANEGARDAGLEKMRLESYIQTRKEREPVTGNNENAIDNAPEPATNKSEKTIQDHFNDLNKFHRGDLSFDEFKQASSDFLDNEEAVKAKLSSLTKPEILKRMGPMFNYNHKGDKKDVIVDAAYQSLAGQLRFAAQGDKDVITETVSFEEIQGKRARKTTASKAREEISALTSEKYGIYQEKAKAATKKAEERLQKVKQQISDPQTLDDFETFLNYRSIDKLTPEQKARYEDLKAERNLDKRDQAAAAAKETKVVPTATGDIVKTKHTKEGHDLFVVKLADRVDRDSYTTINAKAKELGGYYSKFRGDGAVPGFQFRTEEQAKEFQQWLSNAGNQTTSVTDLKATTDITAEPEVTSEESSKKKQADKLRDRAASVREKAQAELNADRKSNTVKRAREAAYAVARAEADLRFANILDAIANGIEAGEIKYLRNMTAGTQLETLDTVLRRIVRSNKMSQAIRDDLIQKGYLRKGDDAELSWTDSAPIEVITQYAEMPGMDYWANILRDTAKNMQTTAGFKQAGVKIMNQVLMAINAENRMVTISDPDLIEKLKQFSKNHEVRDYLKDTMADYDRLVRMGITSPVELRAALRELHKVKQSLKTDRPKRDPVKQKEDALKMRLLNNRNAFVDFFPTPDEHANDVIARAGIEPGMRVLEPSAGHGALAVAARDAGATVDAVELSNDLRDILTEKGFNLVGSDFMATEPAGEYDAVVMNPPFSNDMDIDHVKHAYAHLKPGGRLVAIVSSMAGERSNNKNKQFKEWLDSLGATEEMMPEGSFKNSMNPTSVRTKIIELQKPADSENVKPKLMGSRVTIHTPKGKPVEVQYQLVSAADLVASNEFDGRVNKSYPQELQPRDRTKASYQQQVNQIAANPEGSRLAGSPESDRGAPIVRDLVVESGNGRTIGIKQAYKQGTATEYRDYLIKHADEFGFTADDVNLIDDPVLVRQRVSELSPEERLDFVVDSNTDAKMANSATEDAKADARYLDNGMMDLLNIPEGGDLLAASNERFLSAFATKLGSNSLNNYKDSSGRWNESFRKRVSNAIFAYGYDNDTLLKAATGDTSEAGKNLTNALMNNAAKVAELRSMAPDAAKAFVNYLAEGIDVMTSAKRNGQSIQEVVNQGDMLSGGVSHYGGAIAEMLSDASRSGKRLTETLNQITGMLNESAKAADQIDLLTGEPTQQVTAEEAINAAEKDFNERKQQEQRVQPSQDLFGANSARIGDNNGSGTSVSRPVSASETKSAGENSRLNLVNGLLGGETEKVQFSKMPLNAAEKSGKGMTKPEAELAAKEWLKRFKTDVQVKVAKDQAEFNQMLEDMGQSAVNADEVANAAYIPESKTLLLNASAIQNPARLRQLMRHEILGHHGLEYVIGKGAVNDIMQILKNGYATSKAIRDAVDTVAANYADADVKTKIKEAFAHYAENRPVDQGPLGRLWDRVVSAVKSALVKVGFIKPNEAEQQLDSLLKTIAEHMRNGKTNNDPNGGQGKKTYFSKAVTDDEIRMAKLGLGPKPNFVDKTKAQLEQLRSADKSTIKAWLDQLKRKANTQILDALAPIKYAEEQAGKLDASDSGYVAARLASGSASVMQATMMYGIPQWKDGVIQRKAGTSEKDSLLGIFEELGSDLHNWLAWMAGHRAEILMREGRENLLTEDDIKALKAKSIGKEVKFKAAKEKWNTLNKAMLDLAQEAGLFTADDRAAFESEWYVPFFRETDDGDVMGPYKKNGIANQSSGIKKLKGGTANVNDILENIFQTTSKLIDSSMKNMAAQKVVYNLADTDLIEVVTKPNMLDIKAAVQNKQNLMIVKMEGENYLIRVNDPDLFRAMTMIDGTIERDPFRKAAMKAKHILTAGITASPDFMLRNFLRDAASTWAINEDGFKPMIDSIRGVKKAWKMDDSSIDMMFSGASFMGGNLRGSDPEAMASVIRKTLRRKGMSPEQIREYENSLITNCRKAKDVLLSALEKYEKAGEAVENGSREAVYEAAIKAGKSHAQAAFEAKDLMDFSMLGSSKIMRYMVDVLPFFNARMQGLGKLGRAVAANPKQIARRGGMIAAASLALMALNWDDDRYKNLPDWDKDLNWHFWLGDEHFRIPKPFEVGLMFGTLPERMVRAIGGKDSAGKFGKVVARNMLETFAINPIPQVVKPLTEVYFNYDMFRGAPIENMSDLNVAPEARYDERTSLLMREFGQITGLSPKKLEHIVTGYTGTIGAYVVGICDAIVRASGDYGAAPAIRADQIPVLKSIYQGSAPAKSSQAMTDFYQLLDEANQVYSTIRQYQKEGRMGDAQEMLEENRNKLAGRKTMTNAQKQFRQIRNEMELIQRDRNLNSDEKRERIDRLLSKRNNFAAKLIKRFGTEL